MPRDQDEHKVGESFAFHSGRWNNFDIVNDWERLRLHKWGDSTPRIVAASIRILVLRGKDVPAAQRRRYTWRRLGAFSLLFHVAASRPSFLALFTLDELDG